MQIRSTPLHDSMLIEPDVFGDERGFFMETWNAEKMADAGIESTFVQDNLSRSGHGILRGLHYQIQHPQGKLVRVTSGAVYDVAVDLRRSSPTFGGWFGVELNQENKLSLWIPPGFAHGFLVISEIADFQYKVTDHYAPEHERMISWNDPTLAIEWPIEDGFEPILSRKDREIAVPFKEAEVYP